MPEPELPPDRPAERRIEPAERAEPIEPADPAEPREQIEPAEPADPAEPAEPAETRSGPVGRVQEALRDLIHLDLREQGLLLVHLARWIGLGSVVGVLAGLSSAAFLVTLDWVTDIRLTHPWLLW